MKYWRQPLDLDKVNPISHYLRSMLLQELGEVDMACRGLQNALFLEPDFISAHLAMGMLMRRMGQPQAADKHMNIARELLRKMPPDQIVPETEGMAAGKLRQMIGVA